MRRTRYGGRPRDGRSRGGSGLLDVLLQVLRCVLHVLLRLLDALLHFPDDLLRLFGLRADGLLELREEPDHLLARRLGKPAPLGLDLPEAVARYPDQVGDLLAVAGLHPIDLLLEAVEPSLNLLRELAQRRRKVLGQPVKPRGRRLPLGRARNFLLRGRLGASRHIALAPPSSRAAAADLRRKWREGPAAPPPRRASCPDAEENSRMGNELGKGLCVGLSFSGRVALDSARRVLDHEGEGSLRDRATD